jgi:MinD-like ATPase involved in chromosome partitioning or flagellar assembly
MDDDQPPVGGSPPEGAGGEHDPGPSTGPNPAPAWPAPAPPAVNPFPPTINPGPAPADPDHVPTYLIPDPAPAPAPAPAAAAAPDNSTRVEFEIPVFSYAPPESAAPDRASSWATGPLPPSDVPAPPEPPAPPEAPREPEPAGFPPPDPLTVPGPAVQNTPAVEHAEAVENAPAGAGPFDASGLLRNRPVPPTGGLRRVLWRMSGGRIAFAPTGRDQAREALHARVRTPAASGRRRIAMISLKGGVGKTTTTVMLGHSLASLRGDNVIAVDANPDAGNLAHRVHRETDQTSRDLLDARGALDRYADVRQYTSQADSRLEVLAGESDPALSEAFSATDYEAVLAELERFYSVVLTDCGTGILHDAMRAVLFYADQLVVVTSPAIDSAQALSQLLDWLDKHDYHHLVESAIVVVNGVRKKSEIRIDQLSATFGSRCRAVVTIPYDAALSTGGESSLAALAPATQDAYLELAAEVGDSFRAARRPGRDPRTDPSRTPTGTGQPPGA